MHCRIETNKTKLRKIESHVKKIENKSLRSMTRREKRRRNITRKISTRIRINKIKTR